MAEWSSRIGQGHEGHDEHCQTTDRASIEGEAGCQDARERSGCLCVTDPIAYCVSDTCEGLGCLSLGVIFAFCTCLKLEVGVRARILYIECTENPFHMMVVYEQRYVVLHNLP